MKIKSLFSILLVLLTISGCSPERNPGDLIVGSDTSGLISTGNAIGTYTALYGIEVGHPDPKRSKSAYHNQNLLLALFVLTPQEDRWRLAGAGSSKRPWYYRLFYHARWLHYPFTTFAKPEKNGNILEISERREIGWKFDGRSRSISIAGNTYPVSVGGFVIVKLDRHWNTEVGIGEKSLDTMNLPLKTRRMISECLKAIRTGILALTSACSR